MPANSKYLTQSIGLRFLKITAAIIGGYLVAISFHLAIASWLDQDNIIMTMAFSVFILWVVLMILAFLAKSAFKIWGIYLLLTLIFIALIYLGKQFNLPNN